MRKRNISFIADKLLWFIILLLPLLFAMVFTCASMNNYTLSVSDETLNATSFTTSVFDSDEFSPSFYFFDNGYGKTLFNGVYLYLPSNKVNFSTWHYFINNVLDSDENVSLLYSDGYILDSENQYTLAVFDGSVIIESTSYTRFRLLEVGFRSLASDWGDDYVIDGVHYFGSYFYFYAVNNEYNYLVTASDLILPSNDNIFKTYFNNLNYSLDSWFTFGDRDIIYTSLNSIFGNNSNILPIFIEGSFVPKYLTYMVWIYYLHIVFDFMVFIPRLTHKWMGGVYKDEE